MSDSFAVALLEDKLPDISDRREILRQQGATPLAVLMADQETLFFHTRIPSFQKNAPSYRNDWQWKTPRQFMMDTE